MCVDMYMVANLILLCSLKHISLVWNLKILCKKTWAILFISFFFRRASEYPLFLISRTLVHFFNTFSFFSFFYEQLLHSPCLFFCNWNFSKETFTRTWSIYPIKHIFVSIPSVGVEHFWVDGEHVVAYSQCRSNRYMWSVHDLNLESMISFSTRVTRFDQTQYNDK